MRQSPGPPRALEIKRGEPVRLPPFTLLRRTLPGLLKGRRCAFEGFRVVGFHVALAC